MALVAALNGNYRIPVSFPDTTDVFTDMLGYPEDNRISSTCTRSIRMIIRYWCRSRNLPPQRNNSRLPVPPRTIRSRGTSPQPLGFENRMDWEQLARLGFTSDCLVEYSIITVATASPVSPLAQQSICYSLYQLQDQLDCGHTVLRVRDESE